MLAKGFNETPETGYRPMSALANGMVLSRVISGGFSYVGDVGERSNKRTGLSSQIDGINGHLTGTMADKMELKIGLLL